MSTLAAGPDPSSARSLRSRKAGTQQLEQLEIELLLEALFRHYGFDFRSYARSSLKSTSHARRYEALSRTEKLYRKVA